MSVKYLREAAAWLSDKARFTSNEWTREELLAVTIWRCWNNIDIARRVRGRSPHIGGPTQQKETWRTIVAAKVADGGLDEFDIRIRDETLDWLDQHHYSHTPERDSSGGNESVEYAGTTIKPLWPSPAETERPPQPKCLKKRKAVA